MFYNSFTVLFIVLTINVCESQLNLLSQLSPIKAKYFESLGFFECNSLIPISAEKDINVTFNLFTRDNPFTQNVFDYNPSNESIQNSFFDSNRKSKFIIHGFMTSFEKSAWMKSMKEYFLNYSDYNIFAIDWSEGADTPNYPKASANTQVVGEMITHFINRLINVTNASPEDIHLIGHSLGAHIAGFVGQSFKYPKIAHISGLDPAAPCFLFNNIDSRLDPSDAELVLIIHTNAGIITSKGLEATGFLGYPSNLGHFDFWVNGGSKQPGCGVVENTLNFTMTLDPHDLYDAATCDHGRSTLYPQSINKNCQFIGYQCENYSKFEKGMCADCGTDSDKCKPMDFNIEFWDDFNQTKLSNQSIYYFLKTSGSETFCLFHYQIMIQVSEESSSRSFGQLNITLSPEKSVSMRENLGFEAANNYTKLYVDSNELQPILNISVNWNSDLLLGRDFIIEKISINFMSHFDKRIREEKSNDFCPELGTTLSNSQTVVFEKC